jgi:hypothetical protein
MAGSERSGSASVTDGSPPPESVTSKSGDSSSSTSKKRSADDLTGAAKEKVAKRRAARACVSCRARKVRCDVVEGAPCGNCRWDNVECVVQESRRRKRHLVTASSAPVVPASSSTEAQQQQLRCKAVRNDSTSSASIRRPSHCSAASTSSIDAGNGLSDTHVPHMLYQTASYRHESVSLAPQQPAESHQPDQQPTPQWPGLLDRDPLFGDNSAASFLNPFSNSTEVPVHLPHFVHPLPTRIEPEDIKYLHIKGALTLPPIELQNALLQSYVEYVHPYMPLMELHEFLGIINCRDGLNGKTSLLLYQAVMFAATAFVDVKYLQDAGYTTRKAARRAFFSKTRLLYDFDYEADRLVLVQALLLMTYWYETPDDQKDTWHWMGVAISLAHTIGLHRNPETTSIAPNKQKLWKRVWWSCFMRDRLIALGMRRPTRIKDEDFDVPMLTEKDFDVQVLPENNCIISPSCAVMRNLQMQRELAILCIQKAKLCVCISHMLRTQYSVLIRDKVKPDNTTSSTMMLFPNKKLDNIGSVSAVDMELMAWAKSLPTCCQYRPITPEDVENGQSSLAVQRTLLHMVYYTTVSALHRPQFLPASPLQAPTTSRQAQEMSRTRVRDAAMYITRMAADLHQYRLEGFLPTTGVTVILPAMIIHLLEMKNPNLESRQRAVHRFQQCMRVMEKLREIYAAADFATGFLDAALRKAAIDIEIQAAKTSPSFAAMERRPAAATPVAPACAQTPPPENAPYMTPAETAFTHQKRPSMMLPPNTINAAALELTTTPPQTEFDPIASILDPTAISKEEDTGLDAGSHYQVSMDESTEDMDLSQDIQELDWNAMAGTEVDVDQWLQFPMDGTTNEGDATVANTFGLGQDTAMTSDTSMDWAMHDGGAALRLENTQMELTGLA